ncbi:class F sortase [Streptomyces sp. NPDC090106]|uniref:class F sortase n=1 Tax=Streptomyces sp. NPDC090106 TaxID=3365946 RepID=UPI0037F41146
MSPSHGTGRRRLGTAVLLALCVAGVLNSGRAADRAVLGPAAEPGVAEAGRALPPDAVGASAARAPSRPLTLRIPALGVTAPLLRVGLDRRGAIQAPPYGQPGAAGWYEGSVTPGEPGASIVVGHVDTRTGPAVFSGLGTLETGDRLQVGRADGTTVDFVVHEVRFFDREGFPDARVYGAGHRPELRVITCGGRYDRERRRYAGNIVVFARLDPGRAGERG